MATPAEPLSWNDSAFAVLPLRPVWVGVLLGTLVVAVYLTALFTLGYDEVLAEQDLAIWQARDPRMGLLLALLAIYLLVARRYASLWTRANHGSLEPLFAPGPAPSPPGAVPLTGGLIGVAVTPLLGLLIDRDPGLYLQRAYWGAPQLWTWSWALLLCWQAGRFLQEQLAQARHLSALAAALPRVDLLDPGRLAPFARQGLQAALLQVVLVSIFALNLVDPEALWLVAFVVVLGVAFGTAGLLLPLRGIHQRLRAAKRQELGRVAAALRGEPDALRGSALEARAGDLGVADLLAYLARVESLREWPLDAGARLRLLLYLALPLGSWLGGAFVERLLETLLD